MHMFGFWSGPVSDRWSRAAARALDSARIGATIHATESRGWLSVENRGSPHNQQTARRALAALAAAGLWDSEGGRPKEVRHDG